MFYVFNLRSRISHYFQPDAQIDAASEVKLYFISFSLTLESLLFLLQILLLRSVIA